jgi:hypothetical protein
VPDLDVDFEGNEIVHTRVNSSLLSWCDSCVLWSRQTPYLSVIGSPPYSGDPGLKVQCGDLIN